MDVEDDDFAVLVAVCAALDFSSHASRVLWSTGHDSADSFRSFVIILDVFDVLYIVDYLDLPPTVCRCVKSLQDMHIHFEKVVNLLIT